MNYKKHYDLLIERAKTRTINGYNEKHHIIPRCMGGDDSDDNLVKLYPEEHYLAHQLLVKMYPTNRKLIFAANMMCVGHGEKRQSNKRFGWLRRKLAVAISKCNSGRVSKNKGVPMKQEYREKLQTLWEFTHPDGSKSVVKGLHEFCAKHGLNPSAMSAVCKGRRNHHKGFKLRKLTNITESDNMEYVSKPRKPCNVAGHNSLKVIIDGIEYKSVAECMRETGYSREKIMKIYRGEI